MGRHQFALIIVVVIATSLRLYALGDRCLWLDETLTWRLASFDFGDILARLAETHEADNPPLFVLLIRLWSSVFGSGEFALRLPAALAGAAASPAAYLLTRDLARFERWGAAAAGRWAGVGAAALVASSDLQIHGSREARMYSLGTLFFFLSSWALVRAVRPSAPPRWWGLYSALAAAFLYTHNLALFSVAAQGMFAGIYLAAGRSRAPGRLARREVTRRLLTAGVVFAGVAAAYLPAARVLVARSADGVRGTEWMERPSASQVVGQCAGSLTSHDVPRRLGGATFGAVVVVGVGAATLLFAARGGWGGVFASLAVAVPLAAMASYSVYAGTSLFVPRYLTFAHAGWLAGAPLALAGLPPPRAACVALAGLGVVAGSALPQLGGVATRQPEPGMRGAAELIATLRGPGEVAVTQMEWTHIKLAYYSRRHDSPLLVASIPSRRLHGAIHLRDDELVRPDELSDAAVTGLWLVSSSSYGDDEAVRFTLPGRWRVAGVAWFAQDYFWEGDIRVTHLVRE